MKRGLEKLSLPLHAFNALRCCNPGQQGHCCQLGEINGQDNAGHVRAAQLVCGLQSPEEHAQEDKGEMS